MMPSFAREKQTPLQRKQVCFILTLPVASTIGTEIKTSSGLLSTTTLEQQQETIDILLCVVTTVCISSTEKYFHSNHNTHGSVVNDIHDFAFTFQEVHVNIIKRNLVAQDLGIDLIHI